MLFGLLLILFFSIQLYSNDRLRAVNFVSSDSTLERVGSLVTILNKTPVNLHDDIISASQGLGFYLSLDKLPVVENQPLSPLTEQLKHSMPNMYVDDIRIVSANIKRSERRRNPAHQHDPKREKRKKKVRYNVKLTGSILLPDQRWLNFSSAIDEEAAQFPTKTIIWITLFSFLILIFMAWTVKRALKPIETLAIVAKKIGDERDFKAIPVIGPSEVMPAIIAFNQMQSNLSTFIDDRSRMLAAISHDLRTPITSLRLRLEFIDEGEDQKRMLDTVDQMEKMLKATLDFAKEDAQKEEKQEIEVISLLTTICDDYTDRGVDIQLNSADKLIFRLWPVAFRRVMENLINNSIAYGKDNQGEVHITINAVLDNEKLENESLIVTLTDTGSGIEASQFEEIVKPFVRLDKARDTQDSSVGLGLAISESIVKAHTGKLSFNNGIAGGLSVEINLPKC